jgi:ATP-dependent DNA ligase
LCAVQACRRKQTLLQAPAPLTITGFFETLHKLRGMSGQGANARRQAVVSKLLRSARDVETRYLVRTLIMCLRVGAGYRSVLPPLAKAALLHRSMLLEAASKDATAAAAADGSAQPTAAAAAAAAACAASSVSRVSKAQLDAASAAVLAAYHRCPNIQIIADVLMTHGPEALEQQVQLSCGVPVKPMLARPCTGAADALKLLSSTAAAGAVAASKGRVKQATAAAAAAGLSAGDLAESAMELLMCDSDSSGGNELGFDEADDGSADSGGEAGTAADTAADTAAGGALAWQQAGSGAVAGSSSSSSSLWLLAEFKYDGQRAQIHVTAEREVSGVLHNAGDYCTSACRLNATAALPCCVSIHQRQYNSRRLHGLCVPPVLSIMSHLLRILTHFKSTNPFAASVLQVRIFSRNCEEHTASFPDVCGAILAALDPSVLPVVLDTELVAVDRADGNRLRAFQELATRRRGTSSTAAAAAAGDGGGDGGGGRSSGSGSVAKGAKRPAVAACLASVRTGKGPQQQKLKLQATPSSSTQLSAASTEGAAAASAGATEAPFTAEQQQQRQQGGQVVPSKSVTAGPGQGQGQEAVDVCVFVFDALCVGGRDLMAHSLRERRAAAAAVLITLTPGVVQLAQGIEVQAGTELLHTAPTAAAAATMALPNQAAAAAGAGGAGAGANSWAAADQQLTEYLFTALDAGCEGLMLKLLDGPGGAAHADRHAGCSYSCGDLSGHASILLPAACLLRACRLACCNTHPSRSCAGARPDLHWLRPSSLPVDSG